MYRHPIHTAGMSLILVLVFVSTLSMVTLSLAGFQLAQLRAGQAMVMRAQALDLAEAGLEYYRWFLAHNPGDVTDGTGQPGPYVHSYEDPEAGTVGNFSLEVTGTARCGVLQYIDIASTGIPAADSRFKRVVRARYIRPTVADYAYIINANVWAGADRDIVGPYHANGGIRMDGTNRSTVSSAVASWYCDASFGCDPASTTPGIWGSGSGSALWSFPVPQIDFAGITVDLANLKTLAQTQNGVFLPKISGGSGRAGYHIILKSDGTADIYEVTATQYMLAIALDNPSGGWQRDYHIIAGEQFLSTVTIDPDCPVIYAEDKVWLEGVVSGKITIVAADVTSGFDPDIILQGNITYAHTDGSDGLTAIAEHSVLLSPTGPFDQELRGIFVAQNGSFGRNLYPCWYSPYDKRGSLTVRGSIVSNKRVGSKWSYSTWGCWGDWSGFASRTNSYDRYLAIDPPPATPAISEQYRLMRWREDN